MTSAYHCGNCSNDRSCSIHPLWPIGGLPQAEQREIISIRDFVSKRGCLSHPSAQAALREEGAKQGRERILNRAIEKFGEWYDAGFARPVTKEHVTKILESLRQSQSTGGQK